ncbi:glycosyltransferase family 4 protein [Clostridium sporogenes]|uniref:glycosyltransferase family 4 protein n=1 Tax=Clostridium sporogenes TaxID=1509 RepID=UPI00313ACFF6
MKKILFYINTIGFGGAERVIVNLANEFSMRENKVILVTSFYDKEEYTLDNKVKRMSLEYKNLNESFIKKNIIRTLKLRKICKKERPDIIISFMAEANFRAILATRFLGIKTLISVRNDPNKEYPNILFKLVAKLLYPLVSGCVFQTEDAQKWFSKRIQKKSKIILNHVDKKFYKIDFKGKRTNIVTVGRLEPQKNHKLLIRAFFRIINEFPKENLLIYGDGSLRKELEELTITLGIEDRVIFKGSSMDIQEKIKDAKLFVLSSDYEGLPNVVMEAMTLGIPVISTDCPCGGPKMLIDDNENGILVKANDTQQMANAMRRVLSEPNFANYLAYNAKIKAKEFESNKVFEKWENYIEQIINYK